MKTIVITGGTSGIGQALATTYLDRGDQVIVIGPDPAKGAAFLRAADEHGSGERAVFLRADLSLIAENHRAIEEIVTRFDVIDALVLCARYFQSSRVLTADGIEHNLALFYLSRFLLGHGLLPVLETASAPVIVNIAGPGVGPQEIAWNDLGLEHGYNGWTAMLQGGRLNDLLGVRFAAEGNRTRYVLQFPGGTRTGFAGDFDAATAVLAAQMKQSGQPVESAVLPIAALIDSPPPEPLSAVMEARRLSLDHPSFAPSSAARLEALTYELLHRTVRH
ncbi:SDR family NAD(P)-dependent oxidoreductase [Nocardia salmonicida]|uniref:SDR family NAD(P)-dependent oxidoreductase n=1 Tax=Nocardia salmonicida TaxID=53431 RepID=UPI00363EE1A9